MLLLCIFQIGSVRINNDSLSWVQGGGLLSPSGYLRTSDGRGRGWYLDASGLVTLARSSAQCIREPNPGHLLAQPPARRWCMPLG
jgi:hypothetical protein